MMRFIAAAPVQANATAAANQPRNLAGIGQMLAGETFDSILQKLFQNQGEDGLTGTENGDRADRKQESAENMPQPAKTPGSSSVQDSIFAIPLIQVFQPEINNADEQKDGPSEIATSGRPDKILVDSAIQQPTASAEMSLGMGFQISSLTAEGGNTVITQRTQLVDGVQNPFETPSHQTEQPTTGKKSEMPQTVSTRRNVTSPEQIKTDANTKITVDTLNIENLTDLKVNPMGPSLDELNSFRTANSIKESLSSQNTVAASKLADTIASDEQIQRFGGREAAKTEEPMRSQMFEQTESAEKKQAQNVSEIPESEQAGENSKSGQKLEGESSKQPISAKSKGKATQKAFEQLLEKESGKEEIPEQIHAAEKKAVPVGAEVTGIVKAKAGHPEIAEKPAHMQIASEVLTNLKQEKVTFKMQLKPEGLGEVHVNMVCENGKITLHLEAHTSSTQKLLVSGLSDLRAELSKSNYEVVSLDVGSSKPETTFIQNSFAHLGDRGFSSGEQYQQRQHRQYAPQTLFGAERTIPKYEFFTGSLNYTV